MMMMMMMMMVTQKILNQAHIDDDPIHYNNRDPLHSHSSDQSHHSHHFHPFHHQQIEDEEEEAPVLAENEVRDRGEGTITMGGLIAQKLVCCGDGGGGGREVEGG